MGTVYWITGYSGAGKTTIGSLLSQRLRSAGQTVFMLDGDAVRAILPFDAGHSIDERRRLAGFYGKLARDISLQGIDVVCSTISMFHDVRDWNRKNIEKYVEIYLQVPLDVLRERDPKGLYRKFDEQAEGGMMGLDLMGEEPANPDIVLEGGRDLEPEAMVATLWAKLNND